MADQNAATRKKRDWLSIAGMAAVAGAAAFTSYSGWAGLAEMAGWNHLLAKFLPITVDAYAMTATRVWLSPSNLTKKARAWARRNAMGAIATSVLGNALYHAAAAHVVQVTWPVVVALSAVPPITLGLTTHLWHLADDTEPEPKQSPGPAIAEPDAVRAAYPILGNPSALTLPTATGGRSAPGQGASGAGAPARQSASGAKPSAPRAPRPNAVPTASQPGAASAPVARNWAEREIELLPKADEINAREIAAGHGPVSARALAKELHLGQANAGKLIKALGAAPSHPAAAAGHPATPRSQPPAPAAPGGLTATAAPGPVTFTPTPPDPAPASTPNGTGVHPVPVPKPAPPATASAPVASGPGALPSQREAPIEHANGASAQTP